MNIPSNFYCFLCSLFMLLLVHPVSLDAKEELIDISICDSVLNESGVEGLMSFIHDANNELNPAEDSAYVVQCDNLSYACHSLLSNGYYDSSIQLYDEAAHIAAAHHDSIYQLYMIAYKGNANLFKGDFQEVITVMNYGYGLYLEYGIEDLYLAGYYLHMIGTAYQYLKEDEEALQYLDLALPIMVAAQSDMLFSNYSDRAKILVRQGKYSEARVSLEKGVGGDVWEMEPERGYGHGVYRLLAVILSAEGHYEEALAALDKAERSLINGDVWSMLPAIAMYEKAALHAKNHAPELGLIEVERALEQLGIDDWNKFDYSAYPNLQYVLSTLVAYTEVLEAGISEDDSEAQRLELDELYATTFSVIELLLSDFSTRRGASLLRDYDYLYTLAIDNSYVLYSTYGKLEFLEQGLNYSSNSKSQELRNRLRHKSIAAMPDNILKDKKSLEKELSSEKLQLLKARISDDVDAIAKHSGSYNQLTKALNELISPYVEIEESSEEELSLSQRLKHLDEKEAILDVHEESELWNLWVLTNTEKKWVRSPKSATWSEDFKKYNAGVKNDFDFSILTKGLSFVSTQFCELSAKGILHISVIGDKTLSAIPLELLFSCGDTDYLSSEMVFNYSYDVRNVLKESVDQKTQYEYPVFAWAPSYDYVDADSLDSELVAELVRSGRYNLPGAQLEAQAITAILDGMSIIGEQATKTSFIDNIGKSKVLHLSMHALLDKEENSLSKFLFSNKEGDQSASYLHSFELEKMNLSAELAVLSACETGLGAIDEGEGVMSLGRSFAMAGVSSTVMTLWQVPDRSSSTIMTLFYKYLKKGQGKSVALSNAKKEYVKTCVDDKMKQPYYWAGFALVGNNDPVVKGPFKLPYEYPLYGIGLLVIGVLVKRLL